MKKETWVVVANSSLARIFKLERNHVLVEMEVLEHPESKLHTQDLVDSTKPGRSYDRMGSGRHAIEPTSSPKHQEFVLFAKSLCHHLEQAREQGKFDRLYVAASPIFLGLMRQEMTPTTLQLIVGEVGKDMTHMKHEEICHHLPLGY